MNKMPIIPPLSAWLSTLLELGNIISKHPKMTQIQQAVKEYDVEPHICRECI
jgi:hypothetical protein